MINNNVVVKVNKSEIDILQTISKSAITFVNKKGKKLSWLQFAKKNLSGGFTFFPNKEIQWSALEKLANKISRLYPEIRSGQIVDLISELVNTTVNDCLSATWSMKLISLSRNEKKYIYQTLIGLVGLETYFPHHEYLYPIKQIDQNNWMVKDLKSGIIMQVSKKIQGKYCYFFLQSIDKKTVY